MVILCHYTYHRYSQPRCILYAYFYFKLQYFFFSLVKCNFSSYIFFSLSGFAFCMFVWPVCDYLVTCSVSRVLALHPVAPIAIHRICLPCWNSKILQNNYRHFFGALDMWIIWNSTIRTRFQPANDDHCSTRLTAQENDNIWVNIYLKKVFYYTLKNFHKNHAVKL